MTKTPISSDILSHILSFTDRSTLFTALSVSRLVQELVATILYRRVELISGLPKFMTSKSSSSTPIAITRDTTPSWMLKYVHVVAFSQDLLIRPREAARVMRAMTNLETVVVDSKWPGFHTQSRDNQLAIEGMFDLHRGADLDHGVDSRAGNGGSQVDVDNTRGSFLGGHHAHKRNLHLIVTGLETPSAFLPSGVRQTKLLSHCTCLTLILDDQRSVYRGRIVRRFADVDGPRWTTAIPDNVWTINIILPHLKSQDSQVQDGYQHNGEGVAERLPAAFDPVADSAWVPQHASTASASQGIKATPDVTYDLARMIVGRPAGSRLAIVTGLPADRKVGKTVITGTDVDGAGLLEAVRERTMRRVQELRDEDGSDLSRERGLQWSLWDDWQDKKAILPHI